MGAHLPIGLVFLCVAFVFAGAAMPPGERGISPEMRRVAVVLLALAGIANIALGLWQMWRGD